MKDINNSIKELCLKLKRDNFSELFSVFYAACGIETGVVLVYLATLATDPKNAGFLGYSSLRITLLCGLMVALLIWGFFFIKSLNESLFQNWLGNAVKNNSKLVIYLNLIFGLSALFFYFGPQTGLRGKYSFIFEKLDPILVLVILFCFQLICLLLFILGASLPPENRKSQVNQLFIQTILPVIVLLFPFVFFFPRTIPINGEFYGIANDFIPTSYSYKVYLLDNLSNFHFPLWSPSEAAGFPFYSNPFAQALYPLNIPQVFFYILNGGYSILDHQRFAVFGIAIFALGLFYWLKEFSLSTRSVFFVSLIIPVSFRLAELIRYPAALHSAAWYPWILYALTKMFTSHSVKKLIWYSVVFIFSCFSLVTAGYQYYLYYSLFLFLPYLLLLSIPPTRNNFFTNSKGLSKLNTAAIGISGIITLILTTPYLLKMMNLLSLTTSRGGTDYSFSTNEGFNFIDTLGSLVYPPSSQSEGIYYFSSLCLILVIFYLLSHTLIQSATWVTNNNGKTWNFWYLNPRVKILVFGWMAVISYISYGSESYLFNFLWQYLPYFSHLRFLGRINIVIIPIIALLLAISLDFFPLFFARLGDISHRKENLGRKWLILLCGIFLTLFVVQLFLIQTNQIDPYWSDYFNNFNGQKHLFVISGIIAFLILSITGFLLSRIKGKFIPNFSFIMVLFFIISIADLWHVGAFMWWNGTMKTNEDIRKVIQIQDKVGLESFGYKRSASFIPPEVMLTPVYKVSYNDSWYFERYKKFYKDHKFEKDARQELLGVTNTNRIFFSKSIAHPTILEFLNDSHQQIFSYEIIEFTGDQLTLQINSQQNGYISYIDNWDADWNAYVNGQKVPIHILLTTFKSVRVEKGISEVVFLYEPELFSFLNAVVRKK